MTLFIRPAAPDDAHLIWEWRNDPVVRENSFQSDLIPWETHCAWYAQKLAGSSTRIYVLDHDREGPVGQIRFERRNSERAEVNLSIAPGVRGKGYGRELLARALPLAHETLDIGRFEALVKIENKPSLALFYGAGFTLDGELTVNGCLAVKLSYTWSPKD